MTRPGANDSSGPEILQLLWLQRIRWVALVLYGGIFLGTSAALGIALHRFTIYTALGLGALSILVVWRARPSSRSRASALAGSSLILDVLLLTVLLYACGGYTNPFSMMYLVYVTVAAFFLNARWTWGIFAASTAAFIALFFFHVPIPELGAPEHLHMHHVSNHAGLSLHLHGMLLAFVVIGTITAYFLTRMRQELDLLRGKEEDQLRLMSLATVTAGAAHELATPLGTLTLLGERLSTHLGSDPRWGEDLTIMREELERCSTILRGMRGKGSEPPGEMPSRATIGEILTALQTTLPSTADISFSLRVSEEWRLVTLRDTLITSLQALISNALQSYDERGMPPTPRVAVLIEQLGRNVAFTVTDWGVGMDRETLRQLGDPFFTRKAPGKGLGLGIFLVKLFTNQVSGELRFESIPNHGTKALLVIPQELTS